MVSTPRIAVAAPASGQGKTTVAVGIMAALSRAGHVVAPAKVGPDYIDPGYHALATGRPGRNLDPWLLGGPEAIAPMLAHACAAPTPADVAVVEGVMGLHDGRIGTDGFASTAHVAAITATPVVLVVDISSASRTVAATVHGMRTWGAAAGPGVDGADVEVVGVVLNKAGSPRHADEARRAVASLGLPVLGVLPRDAGVSAPSRHLGLVPVAERADAAASLDRLAEQTAEHVDLDLLLDLARSAPLLDVAPWDPAAAIRHSAGPDPVHSFGGRPRVAVAGGRAFTFRYPETEELLRAAGCEPVVLDPATDRELPAGTAGLYLGGGFPEVHAAALSTNATLRDEIRDAVRAGMPTVAECAGLLYLCEQVDGHPFAGVVPARAAMHPRLTLRYLDATTGTDSVLGPAGSAVRGHEFHRTRTDPPRGERAAWTADGDEHGFALDPAGTGRATVHASYLHISWAGAPAMPAHLAAAVSDFAARSRTGLPSTTTTTTTAPTTEAAGRATGSDAHTVASTAPADAELTDPLLHHGDTEVGPGLVDLAVNVRVSAPPPWLATQIRSATADLATYPSTGRATAAIARAHGVPEEMVLPTAGAAEAFTLVARALAPRRPVVVHPQFTEPDAALRRAGSPAEHVVLDAATGFALDDDAVVRVRAADPDLVVVGNPTNPTGVLHPREQVAALHGPTLLVDEAFLDALGAEREATHTLIDREMAGTLVVRSLTKTWGVAGLRAGYVVGDPGLVARLRAQQAHWSVSTPAAVVMEATATPAARAEAEQLAEQARSWRAHLVSGLQRLGHRPVAGEAPFVLVRLGHGAREALRERGYAVRRGDTFPGLDAAWCRIAVRDPLTTDGLLRAVAEITPEEATA